MTEVTEVCATQNAVVLVLVSTFDADGTHADAIGGTVLPEDLRRMIMDIEVGQ